MIVIIDYNVGNVRSVQNMIKKIGKQAIISDDHDTITQASHLILPGVGAFDHGMKELQQRGMIPLLEHCVFEKKTPILGICLGMQLMTNSSEEGQEKGLSWFDTTTIKFTHSLPVPHMGWNTIDKTAESPLYKNMRPDARFYFVHSYHIPHTAAAGIGTTDYGYPFTSIIQKEHIFGVQFHPEKSHSFGMTLLTNFLSL